MATNYWSLIFHSSVVALESHSFKVGEDITLKLMKRDKDSTFAVPVNQWKQQNKPYNVNGGYPKGIQDTRVFTIN